MHVSLHKAFDFQSDAQPIRGYLRRSDLGCRVIHLRAAVALLINMGVGLDLVGRGIGCEFRVNRLGEREPKAIERRVDFANLEGRLAGQHFEEDTAERVEIGSAGDGVFSVDLLGSHGWSLR